MLIDSKSFSDWLNIQLSKRKDVQPSANINPDTMIYMDSAVIAEVAYMLQQDAITLTNNSFLAYATGDELTNLGEDRGVPRLSGVPSSGVVTFGRASLSPDNYVIDAGTIVSTQPSGVDGTVVAYQTDAAVTLYGTVLEPSAPSGIVLTSGGLIPDGTYSYVVTSLSGDGKETMASPQLDVVVSNGLTTNVISLTRTAVANAVSYNLYIYNGVSFVLLHPVTIPGYVDTLGASASTISPPSTNETGNLEVDAMVVCTMVGDVGNAAPYMVVNLITKPVGIEYAENSGYISGGSDSEDDDAYRLRIKNVLRYNTGKVTVVGYQQTCEAVPGVATATVTIPVGGQYRNEITIIITSSSGSGIPSAALIAEVQRVVNLDENRAVCDNITVAGPDTLAIDYTVNILAYDTRYSQAYLTSAIQDAITAYLPTVPVGSIVYHVNLANVVHDLQGIIDFDLINPITNIILDPTQMAVAGVGTIIFL